MYQERIDFIRRLALEGFGQSKQIPKESGGAYRLIAACAAGDILIREAGGLAPFDFQVRAVFPEYVGRLLGHDSWAGYTYIAVSSRAVWDEPLKRILFTAGLHAED
jgi:hypothetical protein